MQKPRPHEYPVYFKRYISLVPDGEVLDTLEDLEQETLLILDRISEEVGAYRYDPEKWSVKEVIGHVIDTERVFTSRALFFARDNTVHLPGFDQDEFAKNAKYHDRSILDLSEEYRVTRENTLILFKTFDESVMLNLGTVSDYKMSLRTIPYILAGHELHHRNIIEQRYLRQSLL
jgi:hypothetical protein